MGLLDDLRSGAWPDGVRPCKMGMVLRQLDDETVAEVNRIMDSIAKLEGLYTASWLARQLDKHGFRVNHQSILRHARGECCCANR